MKGSLASSYIIAGIVLVTSISATGAEKSFKEKVNTTVIRKFDLSAPLPDAIKKLEQLSGIPISVDWKSLESTGIKLSTKVSLYGSKKKLTDVVDLLLAQIMNSNRPLGWVIEADKLVLTTKDYVTSWKTLAAAGRTPAPAAGTSSRRRTTTASGGLGRYNFVDTPLADVISLYRETAGINFYVNWTALETQGITRETPVSFKLNNISTAQALDYTMKTINGDRDIYNSAYWVVDGNVVKISTGTELNKTFKTRVYDVSSLMAIFSNAKGPRVDITGIGQGGLTNYTNQGQYGGGIGLGGGMGGGGGLFGNMGGNTNTNTTSNTEKTDTERREEKKAELIKMVKSSLREEFWGEGCGRVSFFNNHLIVRQSLLGFKLMSQ